MQHEQNKVCVLPQISCSLYTLLTKTQLSWSQSDTTDRAGARAASNISIQIFAHSSSFISTSQQPKLILLTHWPKSQQHKRPSVFNSAWSKHTICFCFLPIIFTTCILDKVQLHRCLSLVIPPGRFWGIRWSPGTFLMVLVQPLRQPGWGRKLHSVVRWGVGSGSDI